MKFLLVFSLLMGTGAVTGSSAQTTQLSFHIGDQREVIVQEICPQLDLRVVKLDIAKGNPSWYISVVRRPHQEPSPNLLYHSLAWHGPYPSQVEAWQVAEKYFPNTRELNISRYPYTVTIGLNNPVVKGTGAKASFVSGSISISWKKLASPNPPAETDSEPPPIPDHTAWVSASLKEMETIKPGMTRAELLKVFTIEGGLSTGLRRTYVFRTCPFFKVDVEFTPVGRPARDADGRVTLVESDKDLIKSISHPYLAWSVGD